MTPEPGTYWASFEEYLSWDAISNSRMAPALKSIKHYLSSPPIEPSPSMRLGSLVHAGRLEPDAIYDRYVVMPDFHLDDENRRDPKTKKERENPDLCRTDSKSTKYVKSKVAEFEAANSDKEIVTLDDLHRMTEIVKSLAGNALAVEYLEEGDKELSVVWRDEDTGLLCKARGDNVQQHRVTDLKTTRDISTFEKAIADFGYDRQAAFYMDGFRAAGIPIEEFCFVAVETVEPFDCCAAPVDSETIEDGRRTYKDILSRIADYQEIHVASGFPQPDAWRKPKWAFNNYQETWA